MRFFKIELLGDTTKFKEHVVVTKLVKGIGLESYYLGKGRRLGDHYPDDAQLELQNEDPGQILTTFLSNTIRCFIVASEAKRTIEKFCEEGDTDVEYLNFTIIGHNGLPMSSDYWIVNPIGTFDCVNKGRSTITYVDDDPAQEIIEVVTYVFDKSRAQSAPHLFRVPEQPDAYFIDEALGRAIFELEPTNVFLTEIDVV